MAHVTYISETTTKIKYTKTRKKLNLKLEIHMMARLLFDFGVVNVTEDDCEQQASSVALRLQQLTTRQRGDGRSRYTTLVV